MSVDYLEKTNDNFSASTKLPDIPLDSLTLDPFANTRDSRFYYGSVSHHQALTQLQDMLADGNQCWGSLCGSSGLGKTLLRTVLHRSLDPMRFICISIETSLLNFDGLLLEIISQIGGERVYGSEYPDRYSRLSEFKQLLTELVVHSNRHLVLLIDEAQGLDKDTLDGLRNLSNICAEHCNLMSFVLIGGSRLESTLRGLPELAQRMAVRTSLLPLDLPQTGAYLQHRLAVAGSQQAIPFSEQALEKLHQMSRGNPREINGIMKQAMAIAQQSASGLGTASLQAALASRRVAGTGNTFKDLGMS